MELPDFIQIPGILYRDKDIKSLDRDIYGLIYWCVKLKLKKCTLSNATIAKTFGCGVSSVANSLSRLASLGYIKSSLDDKNHRIELIPLIQYAKAPSSTEEPPLLDKVTPLTSQSNRIREVNKNILSNERIGGKPPGEPKAKANKFNNQLQRNKILTLFEQNVGHIPSDRQPAYVAYNIIQLIDSFVKRNGTIYHQLNERELTFDYTLFKAWEWYKKKDYCASTEKLETFKLKMKVFLDDIEKRLLQERRSYGQKQTDRLSENRSNDFQYGNALVDSESVPGISGTSLSDSIIQAPGVG